MAGGFANDGALQHQIDATIDNAVTRVRRQLPQGESRRRCEECDAAIPEARRAAVRLCIRCQEQADAGAAEFALYNRRGSKDSQLR